ncbi:MAG: dihydrodipicolinate reductase [Armatimonadota bacterium]|nr:dihydrodipicolinate reductase [Armatimonadota bacterium]
MTPLTLVSYGLGPIGLAIAGLALERGHQIVGAVDIDPAKVGRDLGVLLGRQPIGVPVTADAAEALGRRPQVVLHSTQSRIPQVAGQIVACLEAGASVVSTCEELAFPWYRHAAVADRIDGVARSRGVAAVGVGVNPGFVMDLLPVVLTAPCRQVRAVRVVRVVDAGKRRLPLQRKVGAGMTRTEFEAGVAAGTLGHVGLGESAAMIADALRWPLDDVTETIEPVVDGGRVTGLHQVARGRCAGREAITLDLTMAVGAPDPRDEIILDADPPIHVTAAGGIHGDVATCAIAVNAIPLVLSAPPGLTTVSRLAALHA